MKILFANLFLIALIILAQIGGAFTNLFMGSDANFMHLYLDLAIKHVIIHELPTTYFIYILVVGARAHVQLKYMD
jgi:hypothetical protein